MQNLSGGYVLHKTSPILRGMFAHTSGLPGQPISERDLMATNRLQATAWGLNRGVLGVARDLLAQTSTMFEPRGRWPIARPDEGENPVPPRTLLGAPERTEEARWNAMSDEEKRRVRAGNARIYKANDARRGRRMVFEKAMETAYFMEEHPRFYFVWLHDFRLRRYIHAAGGLTPQGSDIQKSLMHFADGVPLGKTGYYWLCIRAANCYGLDKLPLDDRFAWADSNAELFAAIAADPLKWERWWVRGDNGKGVEEPWGFLATALEMAQAQRARHREDFVSHLPCPLDGTCNGLQHLSAMGLDPIGARATNLLAGLERQDCYEEVAKLAREIVARDAAKSVPEAVVWYGHVNRGTVKRTVLATPYGITEGGIQKGLIEEGVVPESDLDIRKTSAYFRDVLVDALSGTVVAAKNIMAWIQVCATRMGEAGLPMDWTTPMGSRCRQAYHETERKLVRTLTGRVVLHEEIPDGRIDAGKQAMGSAPQIVHSFDAAHMAATINMCAEQQGIRDFAMIHDSYGVHCGHTTALSAILRQTFVEQYRVNQLERLAEDFRTQAPGVDIPEPPARGTLDIEQVHAAEFFFS